MLIPYTFTFDFPLAPVSYSQTPLRPLTLPTAPTGLERVVKLPFSYSSGFFLVPLKVRLRFVLLFFFGNLFNSSVKFFYVFFFLSFSFAFLSVPPWWDFFLVPILISFHLSSCLVFLILLMFLSFHSSSYPGVYYLHIFFFHFSPPFCRFPFTSLLNLSPPYPTYIYHASLLNMHTSISPSPYLFCSNVSQLLLFLVVNLSSAVHLLSKWPPDAKPDAVPLTYSKYQSKFNLRIFVCVGLLWTYIFHFPFGLSWYMDMSSSTKTILETLKNVPWNFKATVPGRSALVHCSAVGC